MAWLPLQHSDTNKVRTITDPGDVVYGSGARSSACKLLAGLPFPYTFHSRGEWE